MKIYVAKKNGDKFTEFCILNKREFHDLITRICWNINIFHDNTVYFVKRKVGDTPLLVNREYILEVTDKLRNGSTCFTNVVADYILEDAEKNAIKKIECPKPYRIFVVTSVEYGEIEKLEYDDKDLANTMALDFIKSGSRVITVSENKFKVYNTPIKHQPKDVSKSEWPGYAANEYKKHACDNGYLGARVVDVNSLGCFELIQRWTESSGMTRRQRTFITYKDDEMFSVIDYD